MENNAPSWLANLGVGHYFDRVHTINFKGSVYPAHLDRLHQFSRLRKLEIQQFHDPSTLDALQTLGLKELHYISTQDPNKLDISSGFQELEILEWGSTSSKPRELVDVANLSNLQKLRVFGFTLEQVKLGASNLEVVRLEDCRLGALNNLGQLPNLKTLRLTDVRALSELTGFHDNLYLRKVILHNVMDLLHFDGNEAMPALETVVFLNCPKLNSIKRLSPVNELRIRNCPAFLDIDSVLQTQSQLKILDLTDNEQLVDFDFSQLTKLKELQVLHLNGIGLSRNQLVKLQQAMPSVQILSNKKID